MTRLKYPQPKVLSKVTSYVSLIVTLALVLAYPDPTSAADTPASGKSDHVGHHQLGAQQRQLTVLQQPSSRSHSHRRRRPTSKPTTPASAPTTPIATTPLTSAVTPTPVTTRVPTTQATSVPAPPTQATTPATPVPMSSQASTPSTRSTTPTIASTVPTIEPTLPATVVPSPTFPPSGSSSVVSATNPSTIAAATTTPPTPDHDHTGGGRWPGLVIPAAAAGSSTGGTIPESTPIKRPTEDGTSAFRSNCGFSHMNFDDPIVHPNKPGAAHLHTYFGNTQSNASSTGSSLLNAGNSTCDGGTLNRTSYWIPTVLNSKGEPMVPHYNMVYYKSGHQGVAPSGITSTLPVGLQLIAGDPSATSSQGEAGDRQVHWSCKRDGWQGRSPSIPECPQGQELLVEIRFPQCWDGKNLSSADGKSHMAYGVFRVGCPASHPVVIPSIEFNIHWDVPAGGTTGWHLSSDKSNDGRGFSLHGDVILAWDPATSNSWINNCVRQPADCNVGQITDNSRLQRAPIIW
jgi:Domain of unknown function (DUF1996)